MLFLLLLLHPIDTPQRDFQIQAMEQPFSTSRLVRFSLQVANESEKPIGGGKLHVWVPRPTTAWQRLLKLWCSHEATYHQDSDGNAYLSIALDPMAPLARREVHFQATLGLASARGGSAPPPTPSDTQASPTIEVKDPAIITLANTLQAETAHHSAEAIYNWIRANIKQQGYTPTDQGASHCLKAGRGDCSDMSALFCALARAIGIPTRYHAGYVVTVDGKLRANEFHNWATYYDGSRWRLADPQAGVFDQDAHTYLTLTNAASASDAVTQHPLNGIFRFNANHPALRTTMR